MVVKKDPFNVAISGYEEWLHHVKNIRFDIWVDHHDRSIYDPAIADQLYNEAVKILKPEAETFRIITQKDLSNILTIIQSNSTKSSGLYLSALLNATALQEMDGVFEQFILGYRLMTGKRLITRKGSNIVIIGDYCEGDIINFGTVYDSISSVKGLQVNFGTVFILSSTKGGIQINFGERNYMMGNKGIQIDFGDIYYNEVQIDGKHYKNNGFKNKKYFIRNLESKLHEIEKIKNLKDDQDKAIQAIKDYDWRKFEQEVLAIDRQIGNL